MTGQHSTYSNCLWCNKAIKQVGRGRPRRYCKASCRQGAYTSRKYGIEEMWMRFERNHATCYLCGEPLQWSNPQTIVTDHMIATVHGGRTNVDNLRPVHLRCNARKGARLIDGDFLKQQM